MVEPLKACSLTIHQIGVKLWWKWSCWWRSSWPATGPPWTTTWSTRSPKTTAKCSIRYKKGRKDNFDKNVKKGQKMKKPDLEIHQNKFDWQPQQTCFWNLPWADRPGQPIAVQLNTFWGFSKIPDRTRTSIAADVDRAASAPSQAETSGPKLHFDILYVLLLNVSKNFYPEVFVKSGLEVV